MVAQNPIGVFDSGVGGLTTLRKLAQLLPHENLIYLGDTARVPYGNKSPEIIRSYALQCTRFLLGKKAKLIVVACNTVSAVALPYIEEASHVPVIGMIKPGAQAAAQNLREGRIGVIGTQATVQSKSYESEIHRLLGQKNVAVHTVACPLFVPLAEEGWHDHPVTYLIAREYLKPLFDAQIESLILGCTHYPLLEKVIRDTLPGVRLIDSGAESAFSAQRILQEQEIALIQSGSRTIECYVTDLTLTFSKLAHKLLEIPLTAVHQVSVDG